MSNDRAGVPADPRLAIALREPLPWGDVVQVVGAAEETGYEALFLPEIAGREAFSTLAGLAGSTSTLRLGTGVVPISARSPVTTAMAAATVHELSGGRLLLGIGSGGPATATGWHSATWGRPLERTRAYVQVVRDVLAGRTVERGEPFPVAGFTPAFVPDLEPPPIILGALGDRMIELAGEIADGVLLNWCTPERAGNAALLARGAAERAGRDPEAFTVAVYLRACLEGVSDGAALRALAEQAATYAAMPDYRKQFDAMGLGVDAETAAAAYAAGRADQVPERFVDAVGVRGGRSEFRARALVFAGAGVDIVTVYPVPVHDPPSSILGTVLAAAPTTAVER